MDKSYNIIFVEDGGGEIRLLGRSAREYLEIEFEKNGYSVVDVKKEFSVADYLRPGAVNVVLCTSMPLVTFEEIKKLTSYMRRKKLGCIGLGASPSVAKICFDAYAECDCSVADDAFLKVSDAKSYNIVYTLMKERILERLLESGVSIPDTTTVFVDDTASIAPAATVMPYTRILGNTKICGGAQLCASYVEDCVIENGADVRYSYMKDSRVCARAQVGPFSRLRGATIGEECRIGDFVEIKASELGHGVKAAHLSYVGDATVGEGTNVGCGTVFCNYDGKTKHKTSVGKACFIGANTNLVAPLTVGDNAFIAAGTTVNKDVESESFTIGRVRQETKIKRTEKP